MKYKPLEQCYFQLSPGRDFSPESQIPPQKNTQNTKNIKKCIKFTPQICVFPSQNLESRINTAPLKPHIMSENRIDLLLGEQLAQVPRPVACGGGPGGGPPCVLPGPLLFLRRAFVHAWPPHGSGGPLLQHFHATGLQVPQDDLHLNKLKLNK